MKDEVPTDAMAASTEPESVADRGWVVAESDAGMGAGEHVVVARSPSSLGEARVAARRLLKRLMFFVVVLVEVAFDGALILGLRAVMSWFERVGEDHFDHWHGFGRDVVDFMEIALSVAAAMLVLVHIAFSLWGAGVRIWRTKDD